MIDDVIATNDDGSGFYNFGKLLKFARNQRVWFIIGARRIGKTLACLRLACRYYLEEGGTTIWLRNYKTHIKDPLFYSNFLNAAKSRGWCPDSWICTPEGVYTEKGGTLVVEFRGLNTFSETRGNEFSQNLIIQDEFMDEQRKYPKECAKGIMSITATVFSGREDARLIMLSNFISCANPYFAKFRLMPDKKYDVTVFDDRSCAVEVCRGYRQAPIKQGEWGKFYTFCGYGDYATDKEDTLFNLIKRAPTGAALEKICIVTFNGLFGCSCKDGIYYWREITNSSGLNRFTPEIQLVDDSTMLYKYCREFVKSGLEGGAFRYENPNVMYNIMDLEYATV